MTFSRFKISLSDFKPSVFKSSSDGSVSMEYIIVSGFALLVSISAVTWLGSVIKSRMNDIAAKIHAEPADFSFEVGTPP